MENKWLYICIITTYALSACTKHTAICDCWFNKSYIVTYKLGKIDISQATSKCDTLQTRLPYGDSCWAFIE